jgi:hypothetical protein
MKLIKPFKILFQPCIFRSLVVDSAITVNPFDYTPTSSIVVRNRVGTAITLTGYAWALEASDVSGYFGSYKEINVVFAPNFTVA